MAWFSRRSAADFLTSLAKNRRFRFCHDTSAAATALMGVAVVVMSVGAGAFITDHLWVVDQRDRLKSATDAASIAAMVEMNSILLDTPDIEDQGTANGRGGCRPALRYREFRGIAPGPLRAGSGFAPARSNSQSARIGALRAGTSGPRRIPLLVQASAAERRDATLVGGCRFWRPTGVGTDACCAGDRYQHVNAKGLERKRSETGRAQQGGFDERRGQGPGRIPESQPIQRYRGRRGALGYARQA